MAEDVVVREYLSVPDRFEALRHVGTGTLRAIVVAVEPSLEMLDARFLDLQAAGRGGLLILRGNAGTGKSTFLDTVGLFRAGVVSEAISSTVEVAEGLPKDQTTESRLIVVEGREALGEVSEAALERDMHAINAFVRSPAGVNTLVVWPTNTDELAAILSKLASQIGGTALLGIDEPVNVFLGPPSSAFVRIGELTVAALNEGASLLTLGVSAERADELASVATTVGDFLSRLRSELVKNGARVKTLMKVEQPRLWVVVVAGNDPDGDVAAVTRGVFARADIDRLMSATGANVVEELKQEPDTLGILANVLDARIIHIEQIAALAIARRYAGEKLRGVMKAANLSVSKSAKDVTRLPNSDLGLLLAGQSLGTKRRGSKAGGSTQIAFAGLASIAQKNDGLLNEALAESILAAGLAEGYELEKELKGGVKYYSDFALTRADGEAIRVEVMWRKETSRAEIANYVLGKLGNYAKAIGLLKP